MWKKTVEINAWNRESDHTFPAWCNENGTGIGNDPGANQIYHTVASFSEIYPNENSPASTQPQNRKLRKPIEIFDIKAFVSEKKKQRLKELMAQVDDDDDDAIISF